MEIILNQKEQGGVMANCYQELKALVNKHSLENGSNTPDFIMAEFMVDCLCLLEKAIKDRDEWYGVTLSPGKVMTPNKPSKGG